MKRVIQGLFCAIVVALVFPAVARAADNYLPGLDDIYWQQDEKAGIFDRGGEDVSYDRRREALISLETESFSFGVSLLPDPILPLQGRPVIVPMIAVVIDDVGVDRPRSARAAANLRPEATLSYLAYSKHIADQVAAAKAHGHEVMLHLPWEPDRESANPGPHYLSVNMGAEQLQKNLLANLDGFRGYAGVNNHMGSRFSRYRPGLEIVMAELKKRGVFFLDSKTTADSIAGKVAREYGVPTTHRDVFLDHVEKTEFVSAALRKVEEVARRKGSAVAIGHPKDITLAALEAWLPTVEARGFRLVPLSELLEYRQETAAAAMAGK